MSKAQITQLALELPVEERAELAQSLWESIESAPLSEEFLAELCRRDDEMSAGTAPCLTHEEIMTDAKKLLG